MNEPVKIEVREKNQVKSALFIPVSFLTMNRCPMWILRYSPEGVTARRRSDGATESAQMHTFHKLIV